MPGDDLEPIDLEPAGDEARFDPERDRERRPAWVWIGLLGVGLAAWAAIALTTRSGHSHAASTTPTSAPSSVPAPTVHVDRVTLLAPRLQSELHSYWPGRLAAVIDDRLYLLDGSTTPAALVPLPEGHAVIQDQNAQSLLVSTFQQTLVTTRPVGTRVLTAHDFAIRAVAPAHWWLLRDDGTIRPDDNGSPQRVPAGLRVVAAVPKGFIAFDATHSLWDLWSGSSITFITNADQLLAAGGDTAVFTSGCGYGGCTLEIHDLATNQVVRASVSGVPEYAELSPDGQRLAFATTQGEIVLVDPFDARILSVTPGRQASDPSLPFAWTPDSQALLVVQDDTVSVQRSFDGATTQVITGMSGLEQLVALPSG